MKLSVPIPVLKSQARALSRTEKVPLHVAQRRIAQREGYSSWSLLVHCAALSTRTKDSTGELVLLASRLGHGKTRTALEMALESLRAGKRAWFFSLENDPPNVEGLLDILEPRWRSLPGEWRLVHDDTASARTIMEYVGDNAESGATLIIDYLQLLDQRRTEQGLEAQVIALRRFARSCALRVGVLSQVHHTFDSSGRALPSLRDVRLPNPAALALFDRALLLHGSQRLRPAL